MNKLCDLHTHSVFSDGTYTPTELVEAAKAMGLSAIALCDHNTVAGLPEFMAAAQGSTVEAVPGIEFSSDYMGKELHILGLFVQPQYYDAVSNLLDAALQRKEKSNVALIEALNRAGYALDYGQIKAATPKGHVNRAHIAAALTEKGYTPSVKAAFDTLLSPEAGFFQPPQRISAFEIIDFIRSIHAVPVLAHPFLNLNQPELEVFLEKAIPHSLAGMETLYPLFDEETTRTAKALADRFGLLQSGGSDFHGATKPDIRLGSGKGSLAVPMELLHRLKNAK